MALDQRSQFHLPRLALLALALAVSVGCVSETRKVNPAIEPTESPDVIQEVMRVPQQMQDVSGSLLRYHAKYRTLPPNLETLVDERIMSAEQYAALPDYLYSPTDQYKLSDGRVVILVDSEVRIEQHAWCIVREPSGQPRSIQLNVTPISLSSLEAASQKNR